MKKNEKGFTLIEVIIVIVLISVIGALTIPNLATINQSTKTRIDRSTKLLIENAAKIYVANYKEEVDAKIASSTASPKYYCVPIGKLKSHDFLNINSNEVNISDFNNTCIKITKTTASGKDKYTYNYNASDKVSSSEDYIPPVIDIYSKTSWTCESGMDIGSLERFNEYCYVASKDNKDGTKVLSPIDIKESSGTLILTYEAEDAAGNKSKPFKVTLQVSN